MDHRHFLGASVAVCVGILTVAGCGPSVSGTGGSSGTGAGTTTGSAGGSSSSGAVDGGGGDAGYLACMSATGQLDDSLKTCHADADCVIEQEQTDCCGTILYVGVNTASVGAFAACEAAWVSHFPGCGCASNKTMTEDGKTGTIDSDAAAPEVHCIDFTMNGGVCMTDTP